MKLSNTVAWVEPRKTREEDTVLGIRGQYLISLVAMELCYLQRSSVKWFPAGPPESNPLITPDSPTYTR
mgnify:FL=1|jgi:hypothetical protein